MPLGNLTSQFFANVYLHELDYHIKNSLKVKYYIRYVDDFAILHPSKDALTNLKTKISQFLKNKLKLELHQDKSKIIPLSKGIDFLGFRNFYHYRLLRKRNIRAIKNKVTLYKNSEKTFKDLQNSYQGWQAYALWANTYKLRKNLKMEIMDTLWKRTKIT